MLARRTTPRDALVRRGASRRMGRLRALRLYDPERRPSSWLEIVRPDQFVAFAKLADSGASCSAEGRPFATPAEATCLVFDSLGEARQFCSERVTEIPSLHFDIFDSAGRRNPPLLVIVHPSIEHTLEGSPRARRTRKAWALGLLLLAVPLIGIDYRAPESALGLAAFLGVSLMVAASRLLLLNMGSREAERARQERLARYTDDRHE
jgi:hypothetical protein